jgi:hypothetical protein
VPQASRNGEHPIAESVRIDAMVDLDDAANAFLASLGLPRGVANVLPVRSDDDGRLIVWINSRYLWRMRDMPSCHAGYRVLVEVRPEINPH